MRTARYCLFFASALLLAATAGAETRALEEVPRVYLVQLREPAALPALKAQRSTARLTRRGRLDVRSAAVRSYAARLGETQDSVLASIGAVDAKIYSYRLAFNGFAARLTPAQAAKLAGHRSVGRVWADEVRQLKSNASASYMGLLDRGSGLRGNLGLRGEDVVIGVIDSGITPGHLSFSDHVEKKKPRICRTSFGESSLLFRWLCRRYDTPRYAQAFEPLEGWQGDCETGVGFAASDCNNKLIGARWYYAGFSDLYSLDPNEFLSPKDADGHGTHIASVAAGNPVRAEIGNTEVAGVSGIAPRARLAIYKACWLAVTTDNLRPIRASCAMSDLQSAIEDAIADGVDIINYSVGTTAGGPTDPDALALLEAADAGILAVVAAGNSGSDDEVSGYGTIESPASSPWVMAVAASSRAGKRYDRVLQVTEPDAAKGEFTMREAGFTPSLRTTGAKSGRLIGASPTDACAALDNASAVGGAIALVVQGSCSFQQKIANAEAAGAIAVVVYSATGAPTQMTGERGSVDIPAVMISNTDGAFLAGRLSAGDAVEAMMERGRILARDEPGNRIYALSSRGPNPVTWDILKPDVTAPGTDILGAQAPDVANGLRGERFQYLSGTSMAVPQVAGVAALLKEAHPDWSPAALRSAMVTTARQNVLRSDGVTAAQPFDFGGGHVAPNLAIDPGLVYDAGSEDYDAFACGAGIPRVSEEECLALEQAGWPTAFDELNLPSISVGSLVSTRSVRRRVTNVGGAATWTASVVAPAGVDVTVVPDTLSLGDFDTGEFTVTFRNAGDSEQLGYWNFGALTWSDGIRQVRSPMALLTTPIAVPDSISGSGASGSTGFDLEFGYTGEYNLVATNLTAPEFTLDVVGNAAEAAYVYEPDDSALPSSVRRQRISVPADTRYLRIALNAQTEGSADDLDLYVSCPGGCPGGIATLASAGLSADEYVDILNPEPGEYVIDVHGFQVIDPDGNSDFLLRRWTLTDTSGVASLDLTAPASATLAAEGNVTLDWQNLAGNEVYLSLLSHDNGAEVIGNTLVEIVVE